MSLEPRERLKGVAEPDLRRVDLPEVLALANQQRLVRLLVKEVVVDQRVGKRMVRLRALQELAGEGEGAC